MIKNISFDFWQTLFKGNPLYKDLRNTKTQEIIFDELGVLIDLDVVQYAYNTIKRICNYTQEINHKSIQPLQMYVMVLSLLYGREPNKSHKDIANKIKESCDKIFLENPPMLIGGSDTKEFINKLPYNLLICSNTGFTEGRLLLNILSINGINIDKGLFSDVIDDCKPNLLHKLPKHTFHIGDSWCDYCDDIDGLMTIRIKPNEGIINYLKNIQ